MKVMQAYNATSNESPIPLPQAPIAPPTILPPSPVLPLLPMFNSRDFFLPKEILPPKKRTLSRSFSTFALPQEFEIGESSHKTSLERHEEQIETILNYLDEIPLECIEHMEDKIEGLGNGRVIIQRDFDQLETKLQEARTQISRFLREQIRHDVRLFLLAMAPKRTSTSAAPAMDQAAIRKLVADSVIADLEAKAATMANTDNTNRNAREREDPVARKCSYKEFMSCQPFNFKGTEGAVGLICWGLPRSIEGNFIASKPQTLEEAITITQRTFTNKNYQNNHNNNNNNCNNDHQQQNKRQETIRAYAATPTENKGYTESLPMYKEVPISEGSPVTRTETYMETYKNVSQDIRDQLNAEAEAPVYHPQNHPTHYTQNSSTRSQQVATRNREKAIVNSPTPIYNQEPSMVAEDDETSKDKEIDKLMALISLLFKKSTNLPTTTSRENQDNSLRINRGTGYENQRIGNVVGASETVGSTVVQNYRIQCYNCKEFGHVTRECQKPKRVKDAAYYREKMLLCKQDEAGIQLNAEQADWRDDTDDESKDQELEAHYMYMAQIQEVSPDAADSGPIFDSKPVQKVSNDDHYNVFAIESEHPEQSESIHDTYSIEQDEHNVIIDSLDMSYDREQIDQNDDHADLANEPMAFEQRSSKPGFQCMTSGQISSGLDLTYAPSTITKQEPTEGELDLLFEAMYDDYFGGQPKFTSQDDESLESYYSRFYKMLNELTRNQCKVTNHQVNVQFLLQLQPEWQRNAGYEHQRLGNVAGARETVGLTVVQKSGIQCYNCKEYGHVARECQKPKRAKDAAYHRKKMLLKPDISFLHEFGALCYPKNDRKDNGKLSAKGEPSRPVLTRNQLRSDGDMCMYALTASTMEPKNVKEAMIDPA
uniref:CCHC-type domain-containing protein n=1 Tax=Tanacetum cinerariifolium TaxID=118510 RepID=A0A6L2MLU9_TANCI|nr:hypothetical protein [Tanacetum cinerariifolium]